MTLRRVGFVVRAAVPRLTPHVLRHAAIMRLIERGAVPIVQRFVDHAAVATMSYCSLGDDVCTGRIMSALGE